MTGTRSHGKAKGCVDVEMEKRNLVLQIKCDNVQKDS